MPQPDSKTAYSGVAKGFHWLMALIWLAAWAIGFTAAHGGEALNPGHVTTFVHKSIASTVIFLTALRLIWRFTHRPPDLPDSMTPPMQMAAHLGHVAIYALALIVLPLSGWYWSSVFDKPVLMAGFIHLPPLAAPDPGMKLFAKTLHTYTAWFCGAMVAGHIAIAFKHHFVDRDGLLWRMSFRQPPAA